MFDTSISAIRVSPPILGLILISKEIKPLDDSIGIPLLLKLIEVIYAPAGITNALAVVVINAPFIVDKLAAGGKLAGVYPITL